MYRGSMVAIVHLKVRSLMSAFSRLLMIIGSALLAWFIYLQWFYNYTKNLSWFPYLMGFAFFSMFLMFLKNIRRGEIGHLELFGSDMGTQVPQGWYWPPSIAPFLQGIDLTFGFDIVHERLSTLGSIAGNLGIRHYQDQNLSSLQFRANTDSLAKANLFHDLNRLKNLLFAIRDDENRVRYYKVGFMLYVVCWITAFAGHAGIYASSAVSAATKTAGQIVEQSAPFFGLPPPASPRSLSGRIVRLNRGQPPIIPSGEAFIPQARTTWGKLEGDSIPYLLYTAPNLGETARVIVEKPLCSLVPKGEEVFYWTTLPPTHASNMEDRVKYMRKKYWFALGDMFEDVLLEPASATWVHIHEHWSEVESRSHPIFVKSMEKRELPEDEGGGIVCF
jgi:hypothetical protein